MKIGILTFQHSINFGAQLQCYAAQEVLKNMGHHVEVIQFTPESQVNAPLYRGIGLRQKGIVKALYHLFIKATYGQKQIKRFKIFQNTYLNCTLPCTEKTIASIANHFDAIIVGSDQVWGPSTHKEAIYFFGWLPEFTGKRISYAPCCAMNKIEDSYKTKITELLQKFNAISVRNIETKQFVSDLIHKNVPIVLDPTFLHGFEEFKQSFKPPYKKYIFAYIIGNEITGSHKQMIAEIKKVRGNLPVIVSQLSDKHPHFHTWADKTYRTLAPDEWLSLIANADYFYTDSFHGVVFALKSNINFLAYYVDESRKSRFIDLTERFSLEKNIVTSVADAIKRNCINIGASCYDETTKFLKNEINKSISFLKERLK